MIQTFPSKATAATDGARLTEVGEALALASCIAAAAARVRGDARFTADVERALALLVLAARRGADGVALNACGATATLADWRSLGGDDSDCATALVALAQSALASRGPALIVEDGGRLMLARQARERAALRSALAAISKSPVATTPLHSEPPADVGDLARTTSTLAASDRDSTQWLAPLLQNLEPDQGQLDAVRSALTSRLTVIAGGPGSGKTLAASLVARAYQVTLGPDAVIEIAAPTARAASRLHESVQQLPAPSAAAAVLKAPTTLHALLGVRPDQVIRKSPRLDVDAVIVDEASMLDRSMLLDLLAGLPDDARLVLVGDPDQLPAIAGGDLFATIVAAGEGRDDHGAATPASHGHLHPAPVDVEGGLSSAAGRAASQEFALQAALSGRVIRLRGRHRFGSAGGPARADLLEAIRASDADQVITALGQAVEAGIVDWISEPGAARSAALVDRIEAAWEPLLNAPDATAALALRSEFAVVTALRSDAARINDIVLHRAQGQAAGAAIVPLLVTRNQRDLELANGEIGIEYGPPAARQCLFGSPSAESVESLEPAREPGGTKRFRRTEVEAADSAFAITLHKAQGSEYDRVLAILPDTPPPGFDHRWLYTALSRARRHVTLVATPTALTTLLTQTKQSQAP